VGEVPFGEEPEVGERGKPLLGCNRSRFGALAFSLGFAADCGVEGGVEVGGRGVVAWSLWSPVSEADEAWFHELVSGAQSQHFGVAAWVELIAGAAVGLDGFDRARDRYVECGSTTQLTSAKKKELAELRRKNRQLEVENEILKRAAAYFARENVLPK
jgi:hypothetical protein